MKIIIDVATENIFPGLERTPSGGERSGLCDGELLTGRNRSNAVNALHEHFPPNHDTQGKPYHSALLRAIIMCGGIVGGSKLSFSIPTSNRQQWSFNHARSLFQ